jgi:hypothetical protein
VISREALVDVLRALWNSISSTSNLSENMSLALEILPTLHVGCRIDDFHFEGDG